MGREADPSPSEVSRETPAATSETTSELPGEQAPAAAAAAAAAAPATAPGDAESDSAASPVTPDEGAEDAATGVSRETEPDAPALEIVGRVQDLGDGDQLVPRETQRALVAERFPRPAETRVLTIANQKGGVGKTTTAVNLASALSAAGLKVLVLDLDPQGNASTALGIEHHSEVPGVYEVLVEGKALAEVVQRCEEAPDLWCAPATVDLAGAEIELVSMVARESRLQRALAKYLKDVERSGQGRVDYVLIDCPPSLGLLTINAFVAAPEVLIPIQCEYYALEGLSQLLANIELIQEHLNPDLTVSTILLTMYDGRTRLAAQVVEEVRQHFGGQVLRALVPRSVRISEAPSHGQTVMTYDPLSSGALAYLEAAREIAHRGELLVEGEPAAGQVTATVAPPRVDPWSRWSDGTGNRRGVASKEGGA
ncbi:AAA family ATPase [Kineococcus sp. TRM81007]|uniref:ParA family protein n=1 Tax=Kineococcus sp. TRM81007 TaxID=2925831 RepID=UPI0035A93A88